LNEYIFLIFLGELLLILTNISNKSVIIPKDILLAHLILIPIIDVLCEYKGIDQERRDKKLGSSDN